MCQINSFPILHHSFFDQSWQLDFSTVGRLVSKWGCDAKIQLLGHILCCKSSYKSSDLKPCVWESQLSKVLTGFLKTIKRWGVLCPNKVGDTRSTNEYNSILSCGTSQNFKMQMCFVTERKTTPFPNVVKCRPYLQNPVSISPSKLKERVLGG